MPAVREMYSHDVRKHQHKLTRQRRADIARSTLPADLTGQVFLKAREEADKIKARLKEIETNLTNLEADRKAAESEVRKICPKIVGPARVRGDVLSGQVKIVRSDNQSARIKTDEAIELEREKVDPIRKRINALQQEKSILQIDLSELKKIARMATHSDIALIHHLSDKWRARFAIGAAIIGRLPEPVRQAWTDNTIFVDALGYPLPADALDPSGKPDLPSKKVPRA